MSGANPDLVATLRAAGCVFAEEEAALLVEAASDPVALQRLVALRVAGSPLEHILGWAAFCGRRYAVRDGVFVPRRRTELLAHEASAAAEPESIVVELCCGVGVVAAVVAARVPGVRVHAVEIDPAAAACARRNLASVGEVHVGDLFDALPPALRGEVDVLVANAPYVPSDAIATMPPEARDHEPRTALDGGADGMDVQRRIVAAAGRWLRPRGQLFLETSARTVDALTALVTAAGFTPRVARDRSRDATVLIGRSDQPAR